MRTVVIGGGVAGLLAARLARQHGDDVVLVEQADHVGGLLRTAHEYDGLAFDHGTHFVAETGRPEIDALLFDPDDDRFLTVDDGLRPANVFAGRLDDSSVAIDTERLDPAVRNAGIVDLLVAADEPTSNAGDALRARFGETFTAAVFEPVLRGLLGVDDLTTVAPGVEKLFDLRRLHVLTPDATEALKSIARLDAAIAFHDRRQGRNPAIVRYPRAGGVGVWIDSLTDPLTAAGVSVLVGTAITGVAVEANGISVIETSAGPIGCDRVLWTVSPVPLARLLGVAIHGQPPVLRTTTLAHLVVDRPFRTDAHFVYLYDPDVPGFRVTLYPNIGVDTSAGHHCTVEFLGDGATDVEPEVVVADLARVGIIDPAARLVHSHVHVAGPGFPVPTPDAAAALAAVGEDVVAAAPNVTLVGKASGRVFFMSDVLIDAYDRVAEVLA